MRKVLKVLTFFMRGIILLVRYDFFFFYGDMECLDEQTQQRYDYSLLQTKVPWIASSKNWLLSGHWWEQGKLPFSVRRSLTTGLWNKPQTITLNLRLINDTFLRIFCLSCFFVFFFPTLKCTKTGKYQWVWLQILLATLPLAHVYLH